MRVSLNVHRDHFCTGIDEALLGLGKSSVHDLTREDVVLPPDFTRS